MLIRAKRECSLILKLFLVLQIILIPTVFSFFAVNFYPEYFIPGNYAVLRFQNSYAESDHTYNRILIVGDSVAQAAYMPSILSEDTYNYGIGSETPVDGYYRLVRYLENHEKPEYIFCSFNPVEFADQSGIWSAPISSHGMPLDISYAIMDDAENYSDDSGLKRENYKAQLLAYNYGVHVDSVKTSVKAIFYNVFGESCHDFYQLQYSWLSEHKGQWPNYGKGGKSDGAVYYPTGKDGASFPITEMADTYMRRIFDLCEEKNICLIYETVPFNETSFREVDEKYIDSYRDYWKRISHDYPEIIINAQISYYDNRYFSDAVHFNLDGTEKFSNYIREKYSYIFEEA